MFLTGIVGGFLAGLLGIGGGPIYVAVFTTFLGAKYGMQLEDWELVKVVVANTVFAKFFAGLAGCWKHYQMDNFYLKTVLTISVPAIICSLGMAYFLTYIEISKTAFSLIFILLMVPVLIRMVIDNPGKKRFNQPRNIKLLFLNLVGVISGSATALAGLGGGFTIVPLLNSLFNIKIKKVISISLGVIVVVSFFFSIYNLFSLDLSGTLPYTIGAISFGICLPMIVGVTIAAPFGVALAKKLNPYTIRMLFIGFSIIIIVKTLWEVAMQTL